MKMKNDYYKDEMLQANDYQRILQDMADGVMVIHQKGTIFYINARGQEILGVKESPVGETLVGLFMEHEENDAFVQTVLDAVRCKGMKQEQMTPFFHNGIYRILQMSATYMPENNDLILVFTDVTEREAMKKRHHDSAVFISVLFALVCVSTLLHAFLEMVIPGVISPSMFTIIVEALAAVLVVIVYRLNGYSIRDFNLGFQGFRKNLPKVLAATVFCVGVLCGLKALILVLNIDFFPEGSSFLNFDHWTTNSTLYPLTVLYQEIMSRAVVQARLKDVFDGKYRRVLSILISSLIFAAIHIAYGFPLMIGAFLLLSLFGVLYEKWENIWLLCIVHYILGTCANLLNFI